MYGVNRAFAKHGFKIPNKAQGWLPVIVNVSIAEYTLEFLSSTWICVDLSDSVAVIN